MSRKILVVDDEPSIVNTVQFILKNEDYEVIAAYSGEEALEKVRSRNPDLIILDLMLPKMKGHTVHKILRVDEKYANIPVIMLTACGDFKKMKEDMETGAIAYVTKPFDHKVLLGIIKAVLNE